MKPNDTSRINRDHRDEFSQGEHWLAAQETQLFRAIELASTDNLPGPNADLPAALLEEIAELRAIFAPLTVRVLLPVGPRRGERG